MVPFPERSTNYNRVDQKCLIPVSVVVPTKNEERNLPRCLSMLGRFAEVLVVDSASTDATVEIAQKAGAHVLQFQWDGRYPKKRNWVLQNHCFTTNWVLFLDADEIVSEQFCNEIEALTKEDYYNGFWLKYTNYFLGRRLNYGVSQKKLALFRLNKGLYEKIEENSWSKLDMEIHEHPIVEEPIGEVQTQVEHNDYRGLAKFIDRHVDYALWEARRVEALVREDSERWQQLTHRQVFKYKNVLKWWYPWFYFFYAFVVRGGFLDGSAGFHYAFYKAWYFQTIRLTVQDGRD